MAALCSSPAVYFQGRYSGTIFKRLDEKEFDGMTGQAILDRLQDEQRSISACYQEEVVLAYF